METSQTSLWFSRQCRLMATFGRKLDTLSRSTRGPPIIHPFVKRDDNGLILLAIAKVVDKFLVVDRRSEIVSFCDSISHRFTVERFILGNDFIFNCLHITRDCNGSIQIDIQEQFSTILPIEINKSWKNEQGEKCAEDEVRSYQHLAGPLKFFEHGVLPKATFAANYLQQQIARLRLAHLATANDIFQELKKTTPTVTYLPSFSATDPSWLCFSDAS